MIELVNLSKSYREKKQVLHAVKDVNLTVRKGEVFGLIGYSGAGKSTLLRCMNLLERPTAGQVLIDGMDITKLSARDLQKSRRKIGMIFQHFHLLSSATVEQNIAFPLRLERLPKATIRARVRELLELVGLTGYERKYPSQLSGGQKQRVAIARALANEPKVLLCDEATSALDPETTKSILALLTDINRKLGLTIVIVTHQMEVVREVCDRVAVMADGQIVESGTVADIFLSPENEITKGLFGQSSGVAAGSFADADVVDITFTGDVTYEPVLSQVAQQSGCQFSILRGSVDLLKDVPYGRLTLKWMGDAANRRRAIMTLEARGCQVHWHTQPQDICEEANA